MVAAQVVALTLFASPAAAVGFTGGPSVRVTANAQVEFEWITDVAWFGKVEVFNNPDGTGWPVAVKESVDVGGSPITATQHVVTVSVASPLTADTGYYFRVTATDPTGSSPDIVTPTPLPPFFTGAQALTNVRVDSITTNSATVTWQANVIGLGKVAYGTSSTLDQTAEDNYNITDHAIELTGLSPGTSYQIQVSNRHAIDGDDLASASAQFTTDGTSTAVVFTEPHAEPRVVGTNQVSTVSITTKDQGKPVPGIVIGFAVDPTSPGSGTLSSPQATTDSNGVASVQLTATGSGLVRVTITAATATNSPQNIPIVVR